MTIHLASILVLAAIFLIGTLRSANLGALALVATFGVGTLALGMGTDDVLKGFPAELFVILVGVTYLFAIAKANGTVDWLVTVAVRAVRERVAVIPWVMFVISGTLVGLGAVSPAAVAIVAPIGMNLAARYHINPLLMGLMVVHGSAAGNFSPIGVLGVITNGIVERSGIAGGPTVLFLSNLVFNLVLAAGIYVAFGGWTLLRDRSTGAGTPNGRPVDAGGTPSGGPAARTATLRDTEVQSVRLTRARATTVAGIIALGIGSLVLDLDVGLVAMTVAAILTVIAPHTARDAVSQVSWPVVLLICGIVTYVGLLEAIGTVDYLGSAIAGVGSPLVASLLLCVIAAVVSAFASTTGILGALIPLAVPLLSTGQVSAVGLVAALSIASSVVDASPFSTNGALIVANSPREQQDRVYRQLMKWGFGLVLLTPPAAWLALTLPPLW